MKEYIINLHPTMPYTKQWHRRSIGVRISKTDLHVHVNFDYNLKPLGFSSSYLLCTMFLIFRLLCSHTFLQKFYLQWSEIYEGTLYKATQHGFYVVLDPSTDKALSKPEELSLTQGNSCRKTGFRRPCSSCARTGTQHVTHMPCTQTGTRRTRPTSHGNRVESCGAVELHFSTLGVDMQHDHHASAPCSLHAPFSSFFLDPLRMRVNTGP